MKKYIICLLCFIIILCAFFIYRNQYACRRLSCMTMNNLNNFKIKDVYQEDGTTFRALYKDNITMLRTETISHLDVPNSTQYINAGIARMKGLFIDAPAPYPGVISDEITCDSKYKPSFNKLITKNNVEVHYFTGYLNRGLVFGSCTDDQAVNKGVLAFFYCPQNQQAFQLEIIAPVTRFDSSFSKYQEMLESIGCK